MSDAETFVPLVQKYCVERFRAQPELLPDIGSQYPEMEIQDGEAGTQIPQPGDFVEWVTAEFPTKPRINERAVEIMQAVVRWVGLQASLRLDYLVQALG